MSRSIKTTRFDDTSKSDEQTQLRVEVRPRRHRR